MFYPWIQRQTGHGSEQPDPAEDDPAHCKAVGLDNLLKSLPKLFYVSMKNEIIFQISTSCAKKICHVSVG